MPTPPPPYDGGYDTFCVEYAAAYCDALVRCGAAVATGRGDCIALHQRYYCDTVGEEVRRGLLSFNLAAAGACLAGVAPDAGCSASCPTFLAADAGTGQFCLSARDCVEPRSVCGGPTCGGSCQPGGGLNQPCRNTQCDQGLWCDLDGGLCSAPQGVGAPCTADNTTNPQCDPATAWCDVDGGACTALPGNGDFCASFRCAAGTYCDAVPNPDVCRTIVATGQPCSAGVQCGPTGFCDTAANPDVCATRRDAGQPCTSATQCLTGLRCVQGGCVTQRAEGESCVSSECVSGTNCDDVTHVCERVRTVSAGEACTNDRRVCASDSTCVGAAANPDGGPGCFGVCVPRRLGDACTTHTRCPARSYCAFAGDAGVCESADGGNPCSSAAHCTVDRWCSGGACAPKLARGQACTTSTACESPYSCLNAAADGGRVCEAAGVEDAGCSFLFECQLGLECQSGRCTTAGHAGEACVYGAYCFDGACDPGTGTCGPYLDAGSPCSDDLDCASAWCDQRVCRNQCP